MTTPERLRRRQRREGVAVIVIGVLLIFQGWYFQNEDQDQRDCTREQIQQLVETLEKRGGLAQRESDNTASVLLTASEATNGDEVAEALQEYRVESAKIKAARAANPIEFPTGECA
jgi:hypothetical protein